MAAAFAILSDLCFSRSSTSRRQKRHRPGIGGAAPTSSCTHPLQREHKAKSLLHEPRSPIGRGLSKRKLPQHRTHLHSCKNQRSRLQAPETRTVAATSPVQIAKIPGMYKAWCPAATYKDNLTMSTLASRREAKNGPGLCCTWTGHRGSACSTHRHRPC